MKEWIGRLGLIGHLARMVVFGLIGIFLIKAAVDYNSRAAVGLYGALAKIVHRSYGPFALGIVAAGLVAFALYSLSDARYRKIRVAPTHTTSGRSAGRWALDNTSASELG
jgi:hypothetical protein